MKRKHSASCLRRLRTVAKKSFTNRIVENIQERPDERHVTADEVDPYRGTERLTNARKVPLELIYPDPDQPRQNQKDFNDEALAELSLSIQRHGVLQPISVQKDDNGKFKLISGERRYHASIKAGLTEVPCIIMSPSDTKDKFAKQIVENLVRKDLNPIDKAYALLEYKNMLGENAPWEEVEKSLGISETRRKQFIRLLQLPEEIQKRITQIVRDKSTEITEKHARALLALKADPEKQWLLFSRMTLPGTAMTSDDAMREAQAMLAETKPKVETLKIDYTSKEELILKLKEKLAELEGAPGAP